MGEPAPAGLEGAAQGAAGAAVALLVVDDECVVAEASLGACRLLSTSREEIVGRSLVDWLAPDAGERLESVWSAFHAIGGHAGPFELAAGSGEPLDINVTPAVLPGRHLVLLSRSEPSPAAVRGLAAAEAGAARGSGGPTARERQILAMLADGDTDVQIAAKLDLSPATVQTHVRNAKAKLGARTRAQAVAMAITDGLIAEPSSQPELVA